MESANRLFTLRRAALLLGLLAFLVRAAAVLVVFEDRTYFSDEANYLSRAEAVASGEWLGTDTFAPPGPVYFLALAEVLHLGLPGIRLVHAFLGGLAVFLVTLLAGGLAGRPAGVLAGAVTAMYPYLVYIAGVIYTQNFVVPLLLLITLALYRRQAGGGTRWLWTAGLGWGVAGMFAVPSLLTAPFLGIWHALRMRPRSRGFLDLVLLAAVAVLSLVPVTLRNYALDDRFVFISSMGGRAFYWANNPAIDPDERDPERWVEINLRQVEEERVERGWSHDQMDSALSARAWEHVKEDPAWFLGNYARRVVTLWSFVPNTFTENEHTGGTTRWIAMASSAPVVVLSLLGMVLLLPRFAALFPFYAVPLVFTFVFSFFHTTVRYRLTVEPFLIVLAVLAVLRLVRPRWLEGPVVSRGSGRRGAE